MSEILGSNSTEQLAGFISRIQTLQEEKGQVSERIKSEFSEAAACGFDKKALKQILKEMAADTVQSIEHRTIVETYRKALGNLSGTPLGEWARTWNARDAKMRLDADKPDADPLLTEFMKGRKQPTNDAGEAPAPGT